MPRTGISTAAAKNPTLARPRRRLTHRHWILPTTVLRVANGEHFQAVRVAFGDAQRALKADPDLREGPVICGNGNGHMIFLLPPGTRPDQWDVPGTRFLRDGVTVEVPPVCAVRGPDIHWLTPPYAHRPLDGARLRHALTGTPRAPSRRPPAQRATRS
ncbi:hypothetical protein ACIG3E_33140 [Streptomyces sp. NPDC053474]|uniref:hypothetical protein n=1 Tax=Streptomyces sp. NPDC053474 TaxID=3365704 RepID=UPI0037CCDEAF